MPVTYRTQAATAWTVATTSPSVTMPASVAAGDLLLVFFVTNTTTNFAATAGGFARVGVEAEGADASMALYWKKAVGTEGASVAFTSVFNSNEIGMALAMRYDGQHATTPINVTASAAGTTATSKSGPSVTPTASNCLILQFIGTDPGTGAYAATPDSNPVAIERYDSKDAGSNAYIAVQEYQQGAAAAIALDFTGLTSDEYSAVQVAIAPAAGVVNVSLSPLVAPLSLLPAIARAKARPNLSIVSLQSATPALVARAKAVASSAVVMVPLALPPQIVTVSTPPVVVPVPFVLLRGVSPLGLVSIRASAAASALLLPTGVLTPAVRTGASVPLSLVGAVVLAPAVLVASQARISLSGWMVSLLLPPLGIAAAVAPAASLELVIVLDSPLIRTGGHSVAGPLSMWVAVRFLVPDVQADTGSSRISGSFRSGRLGFAMPLWRDTRRFYR